MLESRTLYSAIPNIRAQLEDVVRLAHKRWVIAQRNPTSLPPKSVEALPNRVCTRMPPAHPGCAFAPKERLTGDENSLI